MFLPNNDIIVVDDDQQSLDDISRVFNKHGIPCRTIKYDGLVPIDEPLLGVKIAFLDINFAVDGSLSAVAAKMSQVIKDCISVNNNPFVLVFWTTTQDEDIKPYVDYLKRPDVVCELPKAMKIFSLCKTDFIGNDEDLEQKLNDITNDALTNCLFSFSSVVKHISEEAFNELVGLVEFEDEWGNHDQYEKDLKKFFSNLAIDTYGKKNGKAHPDNAIMEVMSSVFMYRLMNSDSTAFQVFLDLESVPYNHTFEFPNDSISAKLNRIIHVDTNSINCKKRGAVIEIDFRNNKSVRSNFKQKFNINVYSWIKQRFQIDDDFPLDCRLVAVEISALCDYTNDRPRSHRYLLGILCKLEEWNNHVDVLEQNDRFFGDAIYEMDFDFDYKGEDSILIWHLGYIFNDEQAGPIQIFGDVLFTLKTDAVNAISMKFANYMSRFGYNHF